MLSPKCPILEPSAVFSPLLCSPLPSSTLLASPSPNTWAQPQERWVVKIIAITEKSISSKNLEDKYIHCIVCRYWIHFGRLWYGCSLLSSTTLSSIVNILPQNRQIWQIPCLPSAYFDKYFSHKQHKQNWLNHIFSEDDWTMPRLRDQFVLQVQNRMKMEQKI